MDKQTKLAVNLQQDFTEAEKAQGRANLGLAQVASTGDYRDLSNTPSIPPAQVQSDWNQTDTTSVSYIQNKPRIHTYKTYATSYDYPDCMHVRSPGANTRVIVYYPYEDRKKLLFVDDHVYDLKITTSGILPQDDTIETITAKLFTIDTNHQPKYLTPSYTFKAGSSAQFDLHWKASNVLSLTDALLDECAPHIEFDCILKDGNDIAIYCNGVEWHLNVYSLD
jgi:hypothetical protein